MKSIEWIKSNPKMTMLIGAFVVIVILLSMRNCSNNVQDNQDVISSVAQSKIDEYKKQLAEKDAEITTHKQSILSLYTLIKSKDSTIYLKDKKLAQIEGKLSTELKKNHGLTDEDAVMQFAENAGYNEPVIKYDSGYIIPIAPIRYYNDVQSNYDMQKDVNSILVEKIKDQTDKYSFLEKVVVEKDNDIQSLTDKVSISDQIVGEKDAQIEAENKKFKQQKVKTWITGGIGVVLLTLSLLR